jgi:hypothetical protein
VYRRRSEDSRRQGVLASATATAAPSHEADICDRAQAIWLADQAERLPRRQRDAVWLRAEGATVEEIAARLNVSYKGAESLLSRARNDLRKLVVPVLVGVAACLRVLRRRVGSFVGTTAVAVTALVLTIGASTALGNHAGGHALPNPRRPLPTIAVAQQSASLRSTGSTLGRHRAVRSLIHPVVPARQRPRTVVGGGSVSRGPVSVAAGGVDHRGPDNQSFVDAVVGCVDSGVTVSTEYVGCNNAPH